MTNAEKFKEIFGTDLGPKPEEAPCIFDIRNCIPGNTCEGCPYEDFWIKEYEEVDNMTNDDKIKEIMDGMIDKQNDILKEIVDGMIDKQNDILKEGIPNAVRDMIDESDEDNINPNHYKNSTSLECIEAMLIAFGSDIVIAFCLCNAYKYIWRWKNKNGEEDLKKAEWYIEKGRELIGNDLDLTFGSTNVHQRFDSMADYINLDHLKHFQVETESNEDTNDIVRDSICGRCKYEQTLDDDYPCKACIYGVDNRTELWEAKEDE